MEQIRPELSPIDFATEPTDSISPSTLDPTEQIEKEHERVLAELETMRREAQQLVDRNRFQFELFAESAAPRFIFSDAFYMLYVRKEVHMATQWFYQREFSNEQILWATYHELAHFYDFTEDHRAILGKFKDIEASARQTGSVIAEKFATSNPDPLTFQRHSEQRPIDPNRPERGTMNTFEQTAYRIHHEFWNIMDDIYVNSLVAKRKPSYGPGGGHAESVTTLYQEQLFQEANYTNLPRHKQFAYALLRQEMVPDEPITVSDEVQAILEQTHTIYGQTYSTSELVAQFLEARNTRGEKAGSRYLIIEKTLAPVFQLLLERDLVDWQPSSEENQDSGEQGDADSSESASSSGQSETGESPDDKQGGEQSSGPGNQQGQEESSEPQVGGKDGETSDGEPESNESDDESSAEEGQVSQDSEDGKEKPKSFQEALDETFNPGKSGEPIPSPILPQPVKSPEDITDIANQFIDGQKEFEERRKKEREAQERAKREETTEARVRRLKKERDRLWCREQQVDYETLQRYEAVEERIRPYLAALDDLWLRIIYGETREQVVRDIGYFKEGEALDIDEAIREFPKFVSGDIEKVRIMTRSETVRELVHRPDLIRVRFIGDVSGSMDDERRERREILEEAYVLLTSSLRRFETFLNLTRGRTKSKLSVDTETRLFGSTTKIVKPFRRQGDYQQERAAVINAFGRLRDDLGGTRDDLALAGINTSLTTEEVQLIKTKKIMELVFELTDGGTNPEGRIAAKRALAELDQKGVIVRAFQIGTTDPDEQAVFQDVWNTDLSGSLLPVKRGEIVGSEIKNLLPALTRALARYLSEVEL